ncbi:hypothetical protein VHEMI04573 [[Torrubiella] hemipterigena]|uniref:Sodium/calcium exchanger membrane region domain-containing protein n=1 Tax=[Torrubiella] hemipterigena TaxID=1531966 RepID=A0A0A1TEC0_9HYPO|nr:hypothetical protein VHEMI04573 [[Torrubiella] hemipterigena]
MSFNYAQIKRKAHGGPNRTPFGRKRRAHAANESSDGTWNPFRHPQGYQLPARAGTWDNDRHGTTARPALPARAASAPIVRRHSSASINQPKPTRPVPIQEVADHVDEESLRNRRESRQDSLHTNAQRSRRFFQPVAPYTPFTVPNQIRRTLFASWGNLLLLLLPAAIALHSLRGDTVETFVVNFLATFPLQNLAENSLFEIQLRLGDSYASLLYITTFNVVQLISSILLLVKGDKLTMQTTLIGGILANILFILGLSFLAGGYNREAQYYNTTTTHVSANLLSLAATSLLIPTASILLGQATAENLTKQSRGASVILILVYVLFLVYQLGTHRDMFSEGGQKVDAKPWFPTTAAAEESIPRGVLTPAGMIGDMALANNTTNKEAIRKPWLNPPKAPPSEDFSDVDIEPLLSFPVAIFVFLASNVALYFLLDNVVNSIDALSTQARLSRSFIGLILLPLTNLDFTAIKLSIKDEVDMVITLTIGKCIQTALCITPLLVLLGWWLHIPCVNLVFDGFEIVSLFAAILLLNFVVSPGKDTWIQGVLLLADWSLVAIAAFFVDPKGPTYSTC